MRPWYNVVAVIFIALALLGCTSAGGATKGSGAVKARADRVIERQEIFSRVNKGGVQISADGAWLAFIEFTDRDAKLYVAPTSDPSQKTWIAHDPQLPVYEHLWTYSANYLVFIQPNGEDGSTRIYRADITKGETRDLTPLVGVHAQFGPSPISAQRPDEVLIIMNDRDPRYGDLVRVNLVTGKRTRVFAAPDHFTYGYTDNNFVPRLKLQQLPTAAYAVHKVANTAAGPAAGTSLLGSTPKKAFIDVPFEDTLQFSIATFDYSNEHVVISDSRGRETAALVDIELKTGKSTIIAESARFDLTEPPLKISPETGRIQAVGTRGARIEWQVLDEAIKADFEKLVANSPGDFYFLDQDHSDRIWLYGYYHSDRAFEYRMYNRDTQADTALFFGNPKFNELPLVPMHSVTVPTRDGLEMVGYLSLPQLADPESDGTPNQPLPLVLLVHGGPWHRDVWGYEAEHQWLANRGYAVLSVNFRGSTGFGKTFVSAGDREWGRAMQNDLTDAVEWAVNGGIAVREKVAIMGGSYGGYAALAGLAFTPEVYACGVSIVGPSNLETLLDATPKENVPGRASNRRRVGDLSTAEGKKMLRERSPLHRADAIKAPLLIVHGAQDPTVRRTESDSLVNALVERNVPVTYVLFPDEGHGFSRLENDVAFHALAEQFFASCLGGRTESIGDDMQGSSLKVPVGVERIPGLREGLAERDKQGAPQRVDDE